MHALSRGWVTLTLVWATGFGVVAADPDAVVATESLEQVLLKFDQVQRSIHSTSSKRAACRS